MANSDQFPRRLCVAADVVSYGGRSGRRQKEVQDEIIAMFDHAAERSGLDRRRWVKQPAGDGEFAVLPLDEPDSAVIDDYVQHLNDDLCRFNEVRTPQHQIRLRLAVHYGPAQAAANGFAGSAPVITGRLLDSAPARAALRVRPEANLVLIISQRVFEDTVEAGHTRLRPDQFCRVDVNVKELHEIGRLHVPGVPASTLESCVASSDGGSAPSAAASTAEDTATYVSRSVYEGDIHATGAVFGMNFGTVSTSVGPGRAARGTAQGGHG